MQTTSRDMKYQGSMTTQKEYNSNLLVNKYKDMGTCNLSNKRMQNSYFEGVNSMNDKKTQKNSSMK